MDSDVLSKNKFKDELSKAKDKFHIETGRMAYIRAVSREFSRISPTHEGRKEYMKGYNSKEIMEYVGLFPDLRGKIDKYGEREGFWRWSRGRTSTIRRLIYQQLLAFSITIFEAFINEVLLIVFKNEPKCLCCEKQVTWEEVIKLGDSIIDHLAAKKIDEVLKGDWEQIVKEFRETLKINLSNKIESKSIQEIFEIRHVIVHNVGVVDETFINKVKKSKWGIKYDIGNEIVINEKSFNPMLKYIENSVLYIYDEIIEKFGLN